MKPYKKVCERAIYCMRACEHNTTSDKTVLVLSLCYVSRAARDCCDLLRHTFLTHNNNAEVSTASNSGDAGMRLRRESMAPGLGREADAVAVLRRRFLLRVTT